MARQEKNGCVGDYQHNKYHWQFLSCPRGFVIAASNCTTYLIWQANFDSRFCATSQEVDGRRTGVYKPDTISAIRESTDPDSRAISKW